MMILFHFSHSIKQNYSISRDRLSHFLLLKCALIESWFLCLTAGQCYGSECMRTISQITVWCFTELDFLKYLMLYKAHLHTFFLWEHTVFLWEHTHAHAHNYKYIPIQSMPYVRHCFLCRKALAHWTLHFVCMSPEFTWYTCNIYQ